MKYRLLIFVALFAVPAYAQVTSELSRAMEQCRPHYRPTAVVGQSRWDPDWDHCWKILNAFNRAQDAQAAATSASQVDAAKKETKGLADRLPEPSAQGR